MELTLNNTPVATAQADCLVLGFTEGGKLTPSAQAIDDASGGAIRRLLESRDIDTGIGKAHFLHGLDGVAAPRILAVGFGKQEKLDLPRNLPIDFQALRYVSWVRSAARSSGASGSGY